MPDEILEEIFSFLDFGSKKRFALVCKKFNQIFGLPRSLVRIKFHVTKERGPICDITRQYRHIVESGNLIPAATLTKFTNMNSYTKDDKFTCIKANYFVGLLPHFSNLSCFDFRDISYLRGERDEAYEQLQEILTDRMDYDVVEMMHLKTLKIDLKLFLMLNDRFVKFSCTELEKLEIVKSHPEEDFDFAPVKSLITSQKRLQVLRLSMREQKVSQ